MKLNNEIFKQLGVDFDIEKFMQGEKLNKSILKFLDDDAQVWSGFEDMECQKGKYSEFENHEVYTVSNGVFEYRIVDFLGDKHLVVNDIHSDECVLEISVVALIALLKLLEQGCLK